MKVIENTSKGIFKKLFGKDRVKSLEIKETGYVVLMEKSGEIPVSFHQLEGITTNFYFDKTPPYRTLTLVTKDQKEYALNVAPYGGEVEAILDHYEAYQLQGELPDKIEDIHLVLQKRTDGDCIGLEKGNLVVIKRGEKTEYPWEQLQYYAVDKPSNSIQLKFRDKKLYVLLSALHVTNVRLVMKILEKFASKK